MKYAVIAALFMTMLCLMLAVIGGGAVAAPQPTPTICAAPYGWNPMTPSPCDSPTPTYPWWPTATSTPPPVVVITPMPGEAPPTGDTGTSVNPGDMTAEQWLGVNTFLIIACIGLLVFGVVETSIRDQIMDSLVAYGAVFLELGYPFFVQLFALGGGNLSATATGFLIVELIGVTYAVAAGGVDLTAAGLYLFLAGYLNHQGLEGSLTVMLSSLGTAEQIGGVLMLIGTGIFVWEAMTKSVTRRNVSGKLSMLAVVAATFVFVLLSMLTVPLLLAGLASWATAWVMVSLIARRGGTSGRRSNRNVQPEYVSRSVYDVVLLQVALTIMLAAFFF